VGRGGLDIKKGVEAIGKGKKFEGWLWILSGICAFLGIFGFFAKGWPMLILLLISIAIIAAIAIITDDDFQEWLAKCCFGHGDGSGVRYPNMEKEILALEQAGK